MWPTKPWPSIPVIPASGAELVAVVDVVVGVTVSVVVFADGGAASLVCGDELLSPPLKINTDARTAATAKSTPVAATSVTCVVLRRDFRAADLGGTGA